MIKQFVSENFDACVHTNTEDNGTLIGMPYPYTVPCVSGKFQEMYYWDTYFTNVGLILCGKAEQAKNNIDNMLYMVNRFGFMPNGNRTYYLKSSQPPFLSIMVKDIYDVTGDKQWLKSAIQALIKEYEFWSLRRSTPIGLNRYGYNPEMPGNEGMENQLAARIGIEPPIATTQERVEHFVATCESGWDMTPRCEFEFFNYAQICLNSLLFAMEKNIAFFLGELGQSGEEWEQKSQERKALINKYMWSEQAGMFLDYNFKKDRLSPVKSAASLYPLFVGLATKEQAKKTAENLLPLLETDFGLLTCAKHSVSGTYQWDFPQGWAPLHHIAVKGLRDYGFISESKRIAQKYVATVERNFKQTGKLWEKYNVAEGTIHINPENGSKMPPMLGWSAGVYLYTEKILNN